ncbi:hypothetical protein [Infirmifilum sp. NZ]|uniref:hypothetical protein n=1 Tax=Infirmifilum sp. NZ TaxID=2926850 RepID=UPI0027A1D14A|nr:hypothetical protein [Infirmifilum sp. NZ]UNQ73311.1 hypothetical protein MOV14_09395 [Infirmifilum sp. NZ]
MIKAILGSIAHDSRKHAEMYRGIINILMDGACGLPVLLGYSAEEVLCGDATFRLIRRGASAASCGA